VYRSTVSQAHFATRAGRRKGWVCLRGLQQKVACHGSVEGGMICGHNTGNSMRILFALSAVSIGWLCGLTIRAQDPATISDAVLLELYRGARVVDVVDAMATVGYTGVGVMDPKIAPLWRDVKDMSHRIAGIAVTVRYGPTNRPLYPGADLTQPENYDVYRRWRGHWYNEISAEPFQKFIRPGTVIVMDNRDDNDTGSTGSKNIMHWKERGAVGLVSAGGVRDVDEIILQRNPVYTDYARRGRGERIGRNELIDVQRPVVVGGALVHPGDVVVADSDGVVVVPRAVAVRVGQIAYKELVDDIAGRRQLYEQLGLEPDDTVAIREEPVSFFKRLGLPADPNRS
jgi:4-hydroxy-4-methyl-2-oxoglutarate aldolase